MEPDLEDSEAPPSVGSVLSGEPLEDHLMEPALELLLMVLDLEPPLFEATELDLEATELDSEATELDSEATELDSEATELDSEATELDSEATVLDSEATELDSEATELDSEAMELFRLPLAMDLQLFMAQPHSTAK
jgi:predicted nuclease with TOPRIM domain